MKVRRNELDNYIVKIWQIQTKIKEYGPDIVSDNVVASSPEAALRMVLQENKIFVRVYAEVIWNKEQDRQRFEDYAL